jgi:hypothetical protein
MSLVRGSKFLRFHSPSHQHQRVMGGIRELFVDRDGEVVP